MTTINHLCQASSLSDGDLFPLYQQSNSDTRSVPLGVLAAKIGEINKGEQDETIYGLSMSGANFSMAIVPATPGGSVYARISLNATAPNGTITLPDAASRADGQEVLVTTTQAITVLTIVGLGAAVNGAPTSLGIYGFFRLRYDSVANAWDRVG